VTKYSKHSPRSTPWRLSRGTWHETRGTDKSVFNQASHRNDQNHPFLGTVPFLAHIPTWSSPWRLSRGTWHETQGTDKSVFNQASHRKDQNHPFLGTVPILVKQCAICKHSGNSLQSSGLPPKQISPRNLHSRNNSRTFGATIFSTLSQPFLGTVPILVKQCAICKPSGNSLQSSGLHPKHTTFSKHTFPPELALAPFRGELAGNPVTDKQSVFNQALNRPSTHL